MGASAWLRARVGDGAAGAFLLGGAFGLAFCPPLFLLFFGLTLPLALTSPAGAAFPALFGLGTSLPLVVLAAGLAAGGRRPSARGARRAARWLQPAAGAILLLVGISDTLTYWLL